MSLRDTPDTTHKLCDPERLVICGHWSIHLQPRSPSKVLTLPSSWDAAAQGSGVQDHPLVHGNHQAILGYITPWLGGNFCCCGFGLVSVLKKKKKRIRVCNGNLFVSGGKRGMCVSQPSRKGQWSEDSLSELVLSFHYVGSGNRTIEHRSSCSAASGFYLLTHRLCKLLINRGDRVSSQLRCFLAQCEAL